MKTITFNFPVIVPEGSYCHVLGTTYKCQFYVSQNAIKRCSLFRIGLQQETLGGSIRKCAECAQACDDVTNLTALHNRS